MSDPPGDGPRLPRGELLRSRVVPSPRALLEDALDRRLTGYAAITPGDALLLDGRGRGLLTFEDGVPVVAYHERTGRGGEPALADLARAPWRVELIGCERSELGDTHGVEAWRVPPGVPAERVAGVPELAERTRHLAPDGRTDPAASAPDTVAAFLEDTERIERIKAEARTEAEQRARKWGLGDQVTE